MITTDSHEKNPLLAPLSVVIGAWEVTMKHVAIAEPLTWQDSFEWLEDAFIMWHWGGKNEVPKATSIISGKEDTNTTRFMMFYYDSRKISRIFEMSFEKNIWKFWREDSDFYQRFECEISEDGNSITGYGEMSHDSGTTWKPDYTITYTRILPSS